MAVDGFIDYDIYWHVKVLRDKEIFSRLYSDRPFTDEPPLITEIVRDFQKEGESFQDASKRVYAGIGQLKKRALVSIEGGKLKLLDNPSALFNLELLRLGFYFFFKKKKQATPEEFEQFMEELFNE